MSITTNSGASNAPAVIGSIARDSSGIPMTAKPPPNAPRMNAIRPTPRAAIASANASTAIRSPAPWTKTSRMALHQTPDAFGSTVRQLRHHPAQVHFRVSRLEAALHRRADPALGLGIAAGFQEEVRIATEVRRRRERAGTDALLDKREPDRRECGDPMGKRADEIAERLGGHRAIDPAVAFGQIRVVVLRAQDHLERPATPHEAREVLDAA